MQIAGGSGITPMLQVASEIVNNPEDKTQVSLIFANQSEGDIILKDELDQMAAKHDNFQVHSRISLRLLPPLCVISFWAYDHNHVVIQLPTCMFLIYLS